MVESQKEAKPSLPESRVGRAVRAFVDTLVDPFNAGDRQRLIRSMRAWMRQNTPRALLDRVDDVLDVATGRDAVVALDLHLRRPGTVAALDALTEAAKSPIEKMLVEPLLTIPRFRGCNVAYQIAGEIRGDQPGGRGDSYILITPQAMVGGYVADWLLEYRGWKYIPFADDAGEVVERPVRTHAVMVLECDGREFHDITPGQKEKDRRRDRELQAMGYMTLRFSGRDINEDAWRCAQHAISTLIEWGSPDIVMRSAA